MAAMHKHHKMPRHAGGDNSPDNIQLLTVAEHAEAHRILYEQYGRWQDRIAWLGLSGQISVAEATRLVQILANTGKRASDETRSRQSAARKGRGVKHTEVTRKKISLANQGKTIPPHLIAKYVTSRQAADGRSIVIDGVEYPSHSAAAHALKDVWAVSHEVARGRIRRIDGDQKRWRAGRRKEILQQEGIGQCRD
jgi:hypothetical protein